MSVQEVGPLVQHLDVALLLDKPSLASPKLSIFHLFLIHIPSIIPPSNYFSPYPSHYLTQISAMLIAAENKYTHIFGQFPVNASTMPAPVNAKTIPTGNINVLILSLS